MASQVHGEQKPAFYAHTGKGIETRDGWQPLIDHLRQTAEQAKRLAQAATTDETFAQMAWLAGILHDMGKYQQAFQEMLVTCARGGQKQKVLHSCFGAAYLYAQKCYPTAFAVAGHHGGLPYYSRLQGLAKKHLAQAQDLLAVAQKDGLKLPVCPTYQSSKGWNKEKILSMELMIRMLFSCLVDADRLDTAGAKEAEQTLNAGELLGKLQQHINEKAMMVPDGPVKATRHEVLEACLAAARKTVNMFSLTVPTGGGKTLSSMPFALKRAELFPENVRRIFVVLPYLSIIEQNAGVYRKALGAENVVEHHSGVITETDADFGESQDTGKDDPDMQLQLVLENWDAPVIITTSARFFDSLFSNRPSDLRRIHNLARSVVILDEVQTLPRKMMAPIQSMLKGLAEDWDTTFLFCTATQPAFEHGEPNDEAVYEEDNPDQRWQPGTLHEIMPEPARLFQVLKRTKLIWPPPDERWTWEDLADRLVGEQRALCIVNIKKHARELYQLLRDRDASNVKHLSTYMYPAHRLRIIEDIRAKRDEPCILISTQLVEAGVDLDFPVVYRAMAPLDAIAQAAGRCDREGRATMQAGQPSGKVFVFVPDLPEKEQTPPGAYQHATCVTASMVAQFRDQLSIDNPIHIRHYFNRYYQSNPEADQLSIQALRQEFNYPEVGRFALIDDYSHTVMVDVEPKVKEMLAKLEELVYSPQERKQLMRQLQPYMLNLNPSDFKSARNGGAIRELPQFPVISICQEVCYDEELGIILQVPNSAFTV